MPLQRLVIYNLFHTVVLECQCAYDLTIVWKERCHSHENTGARLVHATWRRY